MLQEHLRISLLHQLDNCSQMEDEPRCSGASGLMEHAHAPTLHVHAWTCIRYHA